VIDQTPSAKLAALEERQLAVNEALLKGKITVDQFNEAFTVLDDARNQVLGRSKEDFATIADDGKKAFKDLEFAVQGWGREFTRSLATAVRTKAARPADFTKVAIEGSPHDLFKIVRRLYHPKTANCC
jgi:hypothetical protein